MLTQVSENKKHWRECGNRTPGSLPSVFLRQNVEVDTMKKIWVKASMMLCLIVVVSTIIGIKAWYYASLSRHRINEDTYQQIEVGMTDIEVERLMGVPPGYYGPGEPCPVMGLGLYEGCELK